jgi:multiple sugar transport system substrate-binding protein
LETSIRRRDFLGAAALGSVSAILLAACGQASPAAPATTPTSAGAAARSSAPTPQSTPTAAPAATAAPQSAGQITLRYHARTGSEADALNDRLPVFTQQTGAQVKVETFPGGEYYQKMQTLISGDQIGDVFWMSLGIGWPLWGATGILHPLDEFVASEKFDLTQYYKSATVQLSYQGKLYGLPFKLQPGQMGLYYNYNQIKDAGAKEPTLDMSFDDLVALSKQLTKGSGSRVDVFGFLPYFTDASDVGGGWQLATNYVRAWGAELISEDGTKSLLTDAKFKASVQWLHDVVFKEKAAPSYKQVTGNNPDQMFVAGAATMFQSGSWTKSVQTRVKDKFEVRDSLMPKGPAGKRGSMAIADLIGFKQKTQHVQESWQLVKFLTDKEMGVRLGGGTGGASGTCGGRPDVFHDDRLAKNPLHKVWIDAAEGAEPPRIAANFRTAEYNQALWQKMIGLWIGDVQPTDSFFSDLDSACQQVLDLPKP